MKKFMDKDFLLETETAKVLYHDHAAKMPICDFHNHLNVQEIYEDKVFNDIGEIWLGEITTSGVHLGQTESRKSM